VHSAQRLREAGLAQAGAIDDDPEPVVSGGDEEREVALRLVEEVLDAGEDAVARSALVLGVREIPVHALVRQLRSAANDA